MITEEIREGLFRLQDPAYRDFQASLVPGCDGQVFIGVRTPELRRYAKDLGRREDIGEFLNNLPHFYFDENQLHAFIVSGIRDFDRCLEETERFLPCIDNWATCDQFSPKVFAKHLPELDARIRRWIRDEHPYTVRFGIGMRMRYFLDEQFQPEYLEEAASIDREEYYIRMMIAWYFATALAKQYDAALPYIMQQRLPLWTHNKTIQKAVESYRITPEQKESLRFLRRKE